MKAAGLVVCAMPTVLATRPGFTRGPLICSTALWVKAPSTLCVLATAPSTPLSMADCGSAGMEVEVRSPGFVDIHRDIARVRDLGDGGQIGRNPADTTG